MTTPMALYYDDLLEMDIHVERGTGRITSIVDWADANIALFGTSVEGLETILGVQTSSCWLLLPSYHYLRAWFWENFYGVTGQLSDDDRRAIEVGRVFGL